MPSFRHGGKPSDVDQWSDRSHESQPPDALHASCAPEGKERQVPGVLPAKGQSGERPFRSARARRGGVASTEYLRVPSTEYRVASCELVSSFWFRVSSAQNRVARLEIFHHRGTEAQRNSRILDF